MFLPLLFMLLAVGALLFFAISLIMAKVLITPARMTDGRALSILRRLSPEDLNLPYEQLTFDVLDEETKSKLNIKAWWIPATPPSSRTVLIIHGYSDAKIGAIAWAPTFVSLGYNVFVPDLRAHGESAGHHTTAGYFERHDINALINHIRAQRPAQTAEFILFGVSLGAAVAAGAAALRDDLTAVIMDSPYSDYISAARTHAHANGLPGPWFQTLAIRWAQKISNADFLACSPVKLIPTLNVPLMVISGAEDLFVSRHDMDLVEAATKSRPPSMPPTEYWRVEGTHHVLALRTDPGDFAGRINRFLITARHWQQTRQLPAS